MANVKRTITFTAFTVVDEYGNPIREMEVMGKYGAPRAAAVARREVGNKLATIRDLHYRDETYEMTLNEFFANARKVEE